MKRAWDATPSPWYDQILFPDQQQCCTRTKFILLFKSSWFGTVFRTSKKKRKKQLPFSRTIKKDNTKMIQPIIMNIKFYSLISHSDVIFNALVLTSLLSLKEPFPWWMITSSRVCWSVLTPSACFAFCCDKALFSSSSCLPRRRSSEIWTEQYLTCYCIQNFIPTN